MEYMTKAENTKTKNAFVSSLPLIKKMSSTFTRLIMFDSNFISRFSFHTLCFDHLINFFVVEQRTMCLLLLVLSDAQATHYMISNKQSFVCTKLLIRFRIKCALPFSITVVTTKSQTSGQTFFYQIIHKLRIEGAKKQQQLCNLCSNNVRIDFTFCKSPMQSPSSNMCPRSCDFNLIALPFANAFVLQLLNGCVGWPFFIPSSINHCTASTIVHMRNE